MTSLRSYILALSFLFFSCSHRSLAIEGFQDSISHNTHLITVQEYCQCLSEMASVEDIHGLYDFKAMSGEIVRGVYLEDQQPHFLYGIAHGVDPQSSMIGLTELDAMRCCNWMETSLCGSDSIIPETETGSYLLHDDGTFEKNEAAQLSLLPHDDGTFEIVSKVPKSSTSPLMIWAGEAARDPRCGNNKRPGKFPDCGNLNEAPANRRIYSPLNSEAGNDMGSSLADIYHKSNNIHDDSLIGHTGESGKYIAIKDISFYCLPLPAFIKDCLISEETRQQLGIAGQKIKIELNSLMINSDDFKQKIPPANTLQVALSGKTDWEKVKKVLDAFDQSFNIYNLTRANLATFLDDYSIVVPRRRGSSLVESDLLWLSPGRSILHK